MIERLNFSVGAGPIRIHDPEHAPIPSRAQLAMKAKEWLLDVDEGGVIAPVIHVIRRGVAAFTVICNQISPDAGLSTLEVVRDFIPFDSLIITLDTRSTEKPGPGPGREWEKGEMEQLDNAGRADEHGIVSALNVFEITGGKIAGLSILPYLHTGRSTPLVWFKARFVHASSDDAKLSGWVIAAIEAIASPDKPPIVGLAHPDHKEPAALEALRRAGCLVVEALII